MNHAAKRSSVEFRETGLSEARSAKPGQTERAPLTLAHQSIIPAAIVKRLALSESGFVFDPVSGQSFSVNETGLALLRLAQVESDIALLVTRLAGQFAADTDEIRRDVLDFAERLKDFIK